MDTNKITEKVQDLIIEGKLENAAEEMIAFLDSAVTNKKSKAFSQLYNQSIHQISQLNELKNAKLSGIIDPDDADRKRNQIRMALLDINSRIPNLGSKKEILQPIANNTGDGGSKSNKVLYVIIGVLAVGIIGLSAMFFMKNDKKPFVKHKTEITTPKKPTTNSKNRTNQATKNESPQREEVAPNKRIKDLKLNVVDDARNKRITDAVSKTTTKIDPNVLNPIKVDPKIVTTLLDDFSKITPDKIKSHSSKMRMSAIESSKLKKGSIVVYKTGSRRYGKLEVLEIGSNLKIRATTYASSGSIRKSTPGVLISKNKGCDLDLGIMNTSGMDFQWDVFSDSRKRLQPRDQAAFYQIK